MGLGYSSLFFKCSEFNAHFRNAIKINKRFFPFEVIALKFVDGISGCCDWNTCDRQEMC